MADTHYYDYYQSVNTHQAHNQIVETQSGHDKMIGASHYDYNQIIDTHGRGDYMTCHVSCPCGQIDDDTHSGRNKIVDTHSDQVRNLDKHGSGN